LAPTTLIHALHGFRRNMRASLDALVTILSAKSSLSTRLKNIALFPTGLAVADIVCKRRIGHVHAYWLSGASTVALIASKVANVKWSYSAHSWDIFMADNLIVEKTRSANFGRAVSELGRRGIAQRSDDAANKRLKVIHLGVMPNGPISRANERDPSRAIRILCPAAVLIPVKGHIYLLEALRMVRDAGLECQCVLTGDGPLRAELTQKIKTLHLEDVVSMPGRLPHDMLLEQLRSGAYDVVVLASVERGSEFEGIPVSLMEAMAAGIPCIASDTGGINELIDASCGILVKQRDSRAIGDAIIALASDQKRRNELRENAIQRIAEEFDARASARSLASLMIRDTARQN
jgi:glycosyltransferase involved in cell wall biosynthesis